MELFKKLSEKFNTKSNKAFNRMIKPIDVDFNMSKNEFLDGLSKRAVKLYENNTTSKSFQSLSYLTQTTPRTTNL